MESLGPDSIRSWLPASDRSRVSAFSAQFRGLAQNKRPVRLNLAYRCNQSVRVDNFNDIDQLTVGTCERFFA